MQEQKIKKTRTKKVVEPVIVSMAEDIIAHPLWEDKEPEVLSNGLVLFEQHEDGSVEVLATSNPVEIPAIKHPEMRMIDTIICHCDDSDSEGYDDIEEVRKDHMKPVSEGGRGFSDVAYHFYIKSDGLIQLGRPLSEVGAHAKGYNDHSIGICVHGKKLFTSASLQSLEDLIRKLLVEVPTIKKILGHNDVASYKTCPNYGMKRFKLLLNEL